MRSNLSLCQRPQTMDRNRSVHESSGGNFALARLLVAVTVLTVLTTITIPIVSKLMGGNAGTVRSIGTILCASVVGGCTSARPRGSSSCPHLAAAKAGSRFTLFTTGTKRKAFPKFGVVTNSSSTSILDGVHGRTIVTVGTCDSATIDSRCFVPPPTSTSCRCICCCLANRIGGVGQSRLAIAATSAVLADNVSIRSC